MAGPGTTEGGENADSTEERRQSQQETRRQTPAEQFEFYLKFCRPLVLAMPDPSHRVMASVWVKKIRDSEEVGWEDKVQYLKLLLFTLQRQKLTYPFNLNPGDHDMQTIENTVELLSIARDIILTEEQDQRRATARGGSGDNPPLVAECSADLLEYASAQDIPNFGVHAYYAISSRPLSSWDNADKSLVPRGLLVCNTEVNPLSALKASPKKKEEPPPADKQSTISGASSKAGEGQKTTKQPPKPVEPPLGVRMPESERMPITWGSNLIDVTEPPERGPTDDVSAASIVAEAPGPIPTIVVTAASPGIATPVPSPGSIAPGATDESRDIIDEVNEQLGVSPTPETPAPERVQDMDDAQLNAAIARISPQAEATVDSDAYLFEITDLEELEREIEARRQARLSPQTTADSAEYLFDIQDEEQLSKAVHDYRVHASAMAKETTPAATGTAVTTPAPAPIPERMMPTDGLGTSAMPSLADLDAAIEVEEGPRIPSPRPSPAPPSAMTTSVASATESHVSGRKKRLETEEEIDAKVAEQYALLFDELVADEEPIDQEGLEHEAMPVLSGSPAASPRRPPPTREQRALAKRQELERRERYVNEFDSTEMHGLVRRVFKIIDNMVEEGLEPLGMTPSELQVETRARVPQYIGEIEGLQIPDEMLYQRVAEQEMSLLSASPPEKSAQWEIPEFDFQAPVEEFMPEKRPYQLPIPAKQARTTPPMAPSREAFSGMLIPQELSPVGLASPPPPLVDSPFGSPAGARMAREGRRAVSTPRRALHAPVQPVYDEGMPWMALEPMTRRGPRPAFEDPYRTPTRPTRAIRANARYDVMELGTGLAPRPIKRKLDFDTVPEDVSPSLIRPGPYPRQPRVIPWERSPDVLSPGSQALVDIDRRVLAVGGPDQFPEDLMGSEALIPAPRARLGILDITPPRGYDLPLPMQPQAQPRDDDDMWRTPSPVARRSRLQEDELADELLPEMVDIPDGGEEIIVETVESDDGVTATSSRTETRRQLPSPAVPQPGFIPTMRAFADRTPPRIGIIPPTPSPSQPIVPFDEAEAGQQLPQTGGLTAQEIYRQQFPTPKTPPPSPRPGDFAIRSPVPRLPTPPSWSPPTPIPRRKRPRASFTMLGNPFEEAFEPLTRRFPGERRVQTDRAPRGRSRLPIDMSRTMQPREPGRRLGIPQPITRVPRRTSGIPQPGTAQQRTREFTDRRGLEVVETTSEVSQLQGGDVITTTTTSRIARPGASRIPGGPRAGRASAARNIPTARAKAEREDEEFDAWYAAELAKTRSLFMPEPGAGPGEQTGPRPEIDAWYDAELARVNALFADAEEPIQERVIDTRDSEMHVMPDGTTVTTTTAVHQDIPAVALPASARLPSPVAGPSGMQRPLASHELLDHLADISLDDVEDEKMRLILTGKYIQGANEELDRVMASALRKYHAAVGFVQPEEADLSSSYEFRSPEVPQRRDKRAEGGRMKRGAAIPPQPTITSPSILPPPVVSPLAVPARDTSATIRIPTPGREDDGTRPGTVIDTTDSEMHVMPDGTRVRTTTTVHQDIPGTLPAAARATPRTGIPTLGRSLRQPSYRGAAPPSGLLAPSSQTSLAIPSRSASALSRTGIPTPGRSLRQPSYRGAVPSADQTSRTGIPTPGRSLRQPSYRGAAPPLDQTSRTGIPTPGRSLRQPSYRGTAPPPDQTSRMGIPTPGRSLRQPSYRGAAPPSGLLAPSSRTSLAIPSRSASSLSRTGIPTSGRSLRQPSYRGAVPPADQTSRMGIPTPGRSLRQPSYRGAAPPSGLLAPSSRTSLAIPSRSASALSRTGIPTSGRSLRQPSYRGAAPVSRTMPPPGPSPFGIPARAASVAPRTGIPTPGRSLTRLGGPPSGIPPPPGQAPFAMSTRVPTRSRGLRQPGFAGDLPRGASSTTITTTTITRYPAPGTLGAQVAQAGGIQPPRQTRSGTSISGMRQPRKIGMPSGIRQPGQLQQQTPMPSGLRPPMPSGIRPPMPSGIRPPMPSGIRPPMPSGIRPPMPSGIRPPMPSGIRPPMPSGIRPPMPSGIRQPMPSGLRPPMPSGIRPPMPSGIRPPMPSGIRPPMPSGIRPPMPSGIRPPMPSGIRPPMPSGIRPPMPSGIRPPMPSGIRPPMPSGIRPPMPSGIRPPMPSGLRPPMPSGIRPPMSSEVTPSMPSGIRPPGGLRPPGFVSGRPVIDPNEITPERRIPRRVHESRFAGYESEEYDSFDLMDENIGDDMNIYVEAPVEFAPDFTPSPQPPTPPPMPNMPRRPAAILPPRSPVWADELPMWEGPPDLRLTDNANFYLTQDPETYNPQDFTTPPNQLSYSPEDFIDRAEDSVRDIPLPHDYVELVRPEAARELIFDDMGDEPMFYEAPPAPLPDDGSTAGPYDTDLFLENDEDDSLDAVFTQDTPTVEELMSPYANSTNIDGGGAIPPYEQLSEIEPDQGEEFEDMGEGNMYLGIEDLGEDLYDMGVLGFLPDTTQYSPGTVQLQRSLRTDIMEHESETPFRREYASVRQSPNISIISENDEFSGSPRYSGYSDDLAELMNDPFNVTSGSSGMQSSFGTSVGSGSPQRCSPCGGMPSLSSEYSDDSY